MHQQVVDDIMGVAIWVVHCLQATGTTAFAVACKLGRTEIVALMLRDPRTDAFRVDARGRSVLHHAVVGKHAHVLQLLLDCCRPGDLNVVAQVRSPPP